MSSLFPEILPSEDSPYGPITDGDSDSDDAEEISDSYEQDTKNESGETTE